MSVYLKSYRVFFISLHPSFIWEYVCVISGILSSFILSNVCLKFNRKLYVVNLVRVSPFCGISFTVTPEVIKKSQANSPILLLQFSLINHIRTYSN
jgi:hypothetical protein